MPAHRSFRIRRWVILVHLAVAILLLACGPLARLPRAGGRGGYDTVPIVFDQLPPHDPRAIAVNFAIAQEGKGYTQWPANPALSCGRGGGGCTRTGPDCFDCSGLTSTAYTQAGITIGPTTYYQINNGMRVPCTAADLNGAATTCWQPGDLALFCNAGGPYHVAMYAYDGWFIEAYNCVRNTIFWERTQASMANLCSVRRIVGPYGQAYAAQPSGSPSLLAALGGAP